MKSDLVRRFLTSEADPGLARARVVACAATAAVFVWLFWEVLFLPNNFAFRDSAHFYYPLFEFVQQEWQAGRVPLWDPYIGSGEPLLAQGSSSVFYPGQLLFALPIPYAAAYKLYILLHVLLSAGGAYSLARRWGGGIEAAALCGLSYAFGGYVLFQYCNVVFLCGAAWLPFALWSGDAMLRTRRAALGIVLGLVLALMVLGGDAQLAYEAGLLIAFEAFLLWRNARKRNALATSADATLRPTKAKKVTANPAPRSLPSWSRLQSHPVLLGLAACWAAGLAAIQVLPSMELSRLSDRGYFDVPRSIAEIPAYLARDHAPPAHLNGEPSRWYDAMAGNPPTVLIHGMSIYDYSLPPWRLAEFLWPNFSGPLFPQHGRWLEDLSNGGSSWIPSLYMGLIPLLLALSAWRLRSAETRIAWLSWMVLLAILASLGSYSLGWMWRQMTGVSAVADETGGLYWLLTLVLPGFVEFRYPSKLLVIAALGLSGLAAAGWEQLVSGQFHRFRNLLVAASVASAAGLVAWAAARPWWHDLLTEATNNYYGRLDAGAAYWRLGGSLTFTLVYSLSAWLLLRWRLKTASKALRGGPENGVSSVTVITPTLAQAVVLLTAIDLAWANGWMIASAPQWLWETKSGAAAILEEAERQRDGEESGQPLRIFRFGEGEPRSWSETSSPQRVEEIVRWERNTLEPKYGMRYGLSTLEAAGSVSLYDFNFYWAPALSDEEERFLQKRRGLDALGAKYFILPRDSTPSKPGRSTEGLRNRWLEPRWTFERQQLVPEGPPLEPAVPDQARFFEPFDSEIDVLHNDSHFERAWIVRELVVTPPIESHDRDRLLPILQAILFPFDKWLDLRRTAWIEQAELASQYPRGILRLGSASADQESCRVVVSQPQRVEVEATLASPGLVVLADTYYPGWTLEVETEGRRQLVPVVKTNRVMRGALLPEGRHKLVYRYQPASFYVGAAVSGLTLAAALGLAAALLWKRRTAATSKQSDAAA